MAALLGFCERYEVATEFSVLASGVPELEGDDSLHACFERVSCVCGTSLDIGSGTLYVSTRHLVWIGDSGRFQLQYPQIAMHAVCKDEALAPAPCLYIQLDCGDEMEDDDDDEDGSEEEEEHLPGDIKFIPEDASKVNDIFAAVSHCAALNPDPDMEEEGQSELYYDEEEILSGAGAENRAAMLDYYDSLLQGPENGELNELLASDPSRFDDDEEEDEEEEEEQQPAAQL